MLNSLQFLFAIGFILATLQRPSFAWRTYTLRPTDIKCITNQDYTSHTSCTLDKSTPSHNINAYSEVTQEIKDFRLDIFAEILRTKKESITYIRLNNINGCDLFEKDSFSNPLLKMFKEKMTTLLPLSCPIPAGFQFIARNITLDSKFLPSFVPETNFRFTFTAKIKNISLCEITIYGSVIGKRQTKGRRNF